VSTRAAIDRIVAWLEAHAPEDYAQLRPGASPQLIARVEATLGRELPAAMREAYAIHDGANEVSACFAGLDWLSLDSCLWLRAKWTEVAANDPDEFGRRWGAALLPFASDLSRSALAVDLESGRVLEVALDAETRELATDFAALLERYARELEAGDFVVGPEGLVNRWLDGPGFEATPDPAASLIEALAASARPPSPDDLDRVRAMTPADIDRDLAARGNRHDETLVVAKALGRGGEGWARAFLERNASRLGFRLKVQIVGSCLAADEAFAWAIAHRPGEDREAVLALGVLRDPRLLAWLEEQTDLTPKPEWGTTVFRSGLDWPRARAWIGRGRPLSLLALDALAEPARSQHEQLQPVPVADRTELAHVLAQAEASDGVPRVRKSIAMVRGLYGVR
jgi:cell wall assembly regulator SMI1